jgi:hypothetical protein
MSNLVTAAAQWDGKMSGRGIALPVQGEGSAQGEKTGGGTAHEGKCPGSGM